MSKSLDLLFWVIPGWLVMPCSLKVTAKKGKLKYFAEKTLDFSEFDRRHRAILPPHATTAPWCPLASERTPRLPHIRRGRVCRKAGPYHGFGPRPASKTRAC